MTAFTPIRQTLFSSEGQHILAGMPSPETFPGRMAFARAVCERFQFVDARGVLRESSCIAALREPGTAGRITLPPGVARRPASPRPVVRSTPVPQATDVPDRVNRVSGLAVQLVDTKAGARLLARLLQDEHPQGAVRHGGRQLRYLITSDHGVLGGFVFASPALTLKPRDRWIGWDPGQRRRQLSRVVGLSRFLIRPQVACRHLASKSMGYCLRRMPADFAGRYTIVPVLCETFSGASHWGASLAASGWTWMGRSSGRGRHSRPGQVTERKGIWLRPLCRDWRTRLGVPATDVVPPPRPRAVLAPGDGLAMNVWAQDEFGDAPLHGALVKRLVQSVRIQAMAPSGTFYSAANGDHAAVQGYYRMIERPDDSAFTPEAILATHRERSLCRIRGARTALLIQDGSDLDLATHGACAGPGVIARTKGSAGTPGLHMHSTFAVNGEGIPLGVPRIEFDAPEDTADIHKPPEERKSARWLRGWRDSSTLAARAEGTRVISVMDREGDIAALFAEYHATGGADLLVRARHDRVFPEGPKLFERVRTAPSQATHDIRVDRSSARRSARGRKASAGRDARLARTEVRWRPLELPLPERERSRPGRDPVPLTAVHVLEPHPPEGVEAVEWLLLTTLPVTTRSGAIEVPDLYALRWRIEDWHRILRSGCAVEKTAHGTAGRITRAVTLNAVIAWRLSVLTLLGRVTPEVKASRMFGESEIAVLLDYAGDMGFLLPCQTAPDQPPDTADVSLGEAVLPVARLGGYLNRRNDAPPGHQVIWNGYFQLVTGAKTLERSIRRGDLSAQKRLLVLKEND